MTLAASENIETPIFFYNQLQFESMIYNVEIRNNGHQGQYVKYNEYNIALFFRLNIALSITTFLTCARH